MFFVGFFLIPARKDLKFTSDSCVTLSLGQLPSPTALRVSMRVSAALCVLYGRLCRLFFWEGSPWDFESGLTSGMQWSGTHYLAELKLPLLSLLIVPRQNIWVEALSHSKVRLTSASHVFVDCAPCFNLITSVIIYIYICVYFFLVVPPAVCGFENMLQAETEAWQQHESSLSRLFQHICVISKTGKMKYKIWGELREFQPCFG